MHEYKITYRSRYYPLEGDQVMYAYSVSKKQVRADWHSLIGTDEYKIVKIEEVK